MFFRILQYIPKQTEDKCGNEDRGVYSLIFWNSEDKYKSGLSLSLEPNNGYIRQKMSHKEELVKKCSLENHNTPQIQVFAWYKGLAPPMLGSHHWVSKGVTRS